MVHPSEKFRPEAGDAVSQLANIAFDCPEALIDLLISPLEMGNPDFKRVCSHRYSSAAIIALGS
jgi:hypothetical protein